MKNNFKDYHQNSMIIDSLPIDRKLKRYYLTKFKIILETRGERTAADSFKEAREVLMAYIADPERLGKLDYYYSQFPFRKNGWMKALFSYADTCPHVVLDFMKLYTSFKKPLVSVEESADTQHEYLASRESEIDTSTPPVLKNWLSWLNKARRMVRNILEINPGLKGRDISSWQRSDLPEEMHYFLDDPQANAILKYSWAWVDIFSFKKSNSAFIEPSPSMYKDFESETRVAPTFEEDYRSFHDFMSEEFDMSTDYGRRVFRDQQLLQELVADNLQDDYPYCGILSSRSSFEGYAGRVHHIPKKGTIKRRPIAVPNRFYQAGLTPLMVYLQQFTQQFPRDCTFDQNRFVSELQGRLDRGLYCGSADLSQATDNLPVQWAFDILDKCILPRRIKRSKELFQAMLEMPWQNGSHDSYWNVGQPLGTFPSFGLLALEHNILCEAISFSVGRLDSPYCVLGDDVVFTDPSVREAYIDIMTQANIPLSLHKSYEGRMIEFAGRVFVKNQVPNYTSDHAVITWPSLFDYQRATGVAIPWCNLAFSLRKKWTRHFDSESEACDAYSLASYAFTGSRQSRYESLLEEFFLKLFNSDETSEGDMAPEYFLLDDEGSDTQRIFVTSDNKGMQWRSSSDWFYSKFRPVTTDKILYVSRSVVTSN